MRQATRMLGWTTNFVGLLVLVLMVPIGYSMFSMFQSGQALGFGEPELEIGEGSLTVSFPFFINNTGSFPISDVVIATNVSDYRGTLVTLDKVVIPLVSEGDVSREALELSLGIEEMFSRGLTHLLLNDSDLNIGVSVGFTYAYLVSFEIQLPNQTFPWGAPLHNLSFGRPTAPENYNDTHYRVRLPMSFESHLPMGFGTVQLEFLNGRREIISQAVIADVLLVGGYTELELFIARQDLQRLTEEGFMHLYFGIGGFTFGPVEVPYG